MRFDLCSHSRATHKNLLVCCALLSQNKIKNIVIAFVFLQALKNKDKNASSESKGGKSERERRRERTSERADERASEEPNARPRGQSVRVQHTATACVRATNERVALSLSSPLYRLLGKRESQNKRRLRPKMREYKRIFVLNCYISRRLPFDR